MNLLDSTWFYWAVGIAIGLPAGLIVLTELHNNTRPTEQPSGQAGKSAAKLPATPGRGFAAACQGI